MPPGQRGHDSGRQGEEAMKESRRREAEQGRSEVSARRTSADSRAGSASVEGSDAASAARSLADAPRQARTVDAWKFFACELATALRGLEEDEWLVLSLKRRNRFVQFMCQGGAGCRVEAVSDFYLEDGDHLSERDRGALLELGWDAPTSLPDEFGHRPDGSSNYFLDLANPVPWDELALLAVNTLVLVHGAGHPNALEYSTGGEDKASIRFPSLGIRRARHS